MIQQDMNLKQRKEEIEKKLIESGEKERLKDQLREELRKTGWHDAVTKYCNELIESRPIEETTNNRLMDEIRASATAKISDELKEGLLQKIKNFIEESQENE